MKNQMMALCDPQEDYLCRMTAYLEEKSGLPFPVCAFTDTAKLLKFCAGGGVALLLIAEELYRKELEEVCDGQIMILSESGGGADGELLRIDRYQSAENICREIRNGYKGRAELAGTFFPTGRMKIIGNYSPIRRCLQTTFSLCMGQLLARKHRVLYLNFESYSGFGYLLNREFTADLSDALYFFQCGKERLAERLSEMVQSVNGLSYIPPALSYEDLNAVTGRQWIGLFKEIEKAAGYDYLILDLSEQMQGLFDLLKECCKVYTITGRDSFAEAKMKQYELLLAMNEYGSVSQRTRKCELPVFKRLPEGLEKLTHGDLAAYVEKIIKEDLDGDRRGADGNTGSDKEAVKGADPYKD